MLWPYTEHGIVVFAVGGEPLLNGSRLHAHLAEALPAYAGDFEVDAISGPFTKTESGFMNVDRLDSDFERRAQAVEVWFVGPPQLM